MSAQLDQIQHIVVLMLENRSFDHMLGYLSLNGGRTDVDGLDGTHRNQHSNAAWHVSRPANTTHFLDDPNHDWPNVANQLSGSNGGFVRDFEKLTHGHRNRKEAHDRIMDYHTAEQVPMFDFLATEYCISDRWFSSVPGPTQPNRMYALAGTSNGIKNNLSTFKLVTQGWRVKPIFRFLPREVSWRCYSFDISTLRFVSGFRGVVSEIDKIYKFFDDAKDGTLANITWIDPHFDLLWGIYPGKGNDDHPDHDIKHGQRLVGDIYRALSRGPKWDKTLFVVVYDEHGGFYDHVSPRGYVPADEYPEFRHYGARVPALIASPWVGKGLCYGRDSGHVFDHTSVLKTIVNRFCRGAAGEVPRMTDRVDAATDLSVMLTETSVRVAEDVDANKLSVGTFSAAKNKMLNASITGLQMEDESEAEMEIYRLRLESDALADNVVDKGLKTDELIDLDKAFKSVRRTEIRKTAEPRKPNDLQNALQELANSIRRPKDSSSVPLNKL